MTTQAKAGSANYLSTRAIRYVNGPRPKGRIVALECPTCGRKWHVAGRGRETGFIVAAADSHTHKCARELDEARRS